MTRLFQFFILVTCISLLSTAHAGSHEYRPSLIREQLINTRQCPGCTLIYADLTLTNLSGVNLSGANLSEADLTLSNLARSEERRVGKECRL